MLLSEFQDILAGYARDMKELAFKVEVQQLLAGAKQLPIHLLPKPIQHTIYLSYIKGKRRVVGIRTKDGEELLATVADTSVDLVVLNLDIEHPNARPKAHRCIRITDIETLAVAPIKKTMENVK